MSRLLIGFSILLAHTGCAHLSVAPTETVVWRAAAKPPPKQVVYVTSNGLHTGLILRTADVPRDAWPNVDRVQHEWVEIGWGSEMFYRAKQVTPSLVLRAIFPNSSVLHVVGWDTSPEQTFAGQLFRLELDRPDFVKLCRHISDTYKRDSSGKVEYLGPGIYGDSSFYRARGYYYFPNTCNVWTARGLHMAGVPIVPATCSFGDVVMFSVARAGKDVTRKSQKRR